MSPTYALPFGAIQIIRDTLFVTFLTQFKNNFELYNKESYFCILFYSLKHALQNDQNHSLKKVQPLRPLPNGFTSFLITKSHSMVYQMDFKDCLAKHHFLKVALKFFFLEKMDIYFIRFPFDNVYLFDLCFKNFN